MNTSPTVGPTGTIDIYAGTTNMMPTTSTAYSTRGSETVQTTKASSIKDNDNHVGMIIGICICVLAAVVLVIFIIILCKRYSKRPSRDIEDNAEANIGGRFQCWLASSLAWIRGLLEEIRDSVTDRQHSRPSIQ